MSGKIDGIKKRAEAYATHGTPGLNAPQDRKDLLAVILSIEELLSYWDTLADGDRYYAETIRARIRAALG